MIAVPEFGVRLEAARIVAVVTLERESDAAPLAQALAEGGIRAVEVALRTPASLEALHAMRFARPDFLLGAGTALNGAQVEAAKVAGADFALAPGLDAETVKHAARIGLPFMPGVATASEIQAAAGLGCQLLKFFPAEPLGGARGLRTVAAPFQHLGMRFLPLGGITLAGMTDYLVEPTVIAVGGSWIAPSELIRRGAWSEIQANAARAAAMVHQT